MQSELQQGIARLERTWWKVLVAGRMIRKGSCFVEGFEMDTVVVWVSWSPVEGFEMEVVVVWVSWSPFLYIGFCRIGWCF